MAWVEPLETAFGQLRPVNLDAAVVWQLKCPGCGQWADLDDDQLNGRVSVDHAVDGCPGGYHETHDFAAAIREGRSSAAETVECPYCGAAVPHLEEEEGVCVYVLGEHGDCEGSGVRVEFAKVEVVARLGAWAMLPTDGLALLVQERLGEGAVALHSHASGSAQTTHDAVDRDFDVARGALAELVRRAGA